MTYHHPYGAIPGYDALVKYKAKQQRQRDWQKNVGSKGRRIVYEDRRPDYGSTSEAFKQITGQVASYVGSAYLPFRTFNKFGRRRGRLARRYFKRW